VVLDLWATWCPPCRAEIPQLIDLQKKFKGKAVMIVGVSLDDTKSKAVDFAKAQGINYTVAHDPRGAKVGGLYQIKGIPATYVIDKKGVIRYAHSGFPRDPQAGKEEAALIAREINTLLAQK
jgi:peroxiredoxin